MASIADSIKLREGRRQSSGNSAQSVYTGHPLDEVSDPEADTIVVNTPAVSKSNAATTTSTSKKAVPRASATRKNSSSTSAASKARGVRKESMTKAPRKQGAKSQASTKGASKSAQSPALTYDVGKDFRTPITSPSDMQPPKRKPASSDGKNASQKRVKLNDDGSDSELSDLGQTPEPPTFAQTTPDARLESNRQAPPDLVPPATPTSLLPPTPVTAPAKSSKIVRLKVPTQQLSPPSSRLATSLYTPPSSSAPPKRAPRRNSKKSDVLVENEDDDYEELGGSGESPTAAKAAGKRRVGTSRPAPRKKPATSQEPASHRQSTSNQAKTEAAIPTSLAEQSLPSPPSSQSSQSDFLENIDPELLKLSRSLAHREPLESKPLPIRKPEVWAPGRQELCETLPYYKSAHSGCYANNGNIYAFMFDSVGTSREYMDQDVIIARMGGSMATDARSGVMYQKADHDINDMQPQSVLNNMAQRNPLVIICGSQNQGSVTKMPHRYCVLDWFKPTHVWGEMSKGKKGPVKTIRYRFERLDRSKAAWYSASNVPGNDDTPADLALEVKECGTCGKSCPQVYLLGWMCTNPECSDMWKLPSGQIAPYGDLDYHPAFLLHKTTWEREDPPFSLNPGVPQLNQLFGDNLSYVNTRGVVCPDCGRCNTRYLFTGWRCDTQGCGWKLMPEHQVIMPKNLHHTPWDITSAGPSLIKATAKPAVNTQVKYFHNYKVVKYTIQGVDGSVIVAKANSKIVSEAGGPDDMFREMQSVDVGLERRMLRKSADVESDQQKEPILKPTDEDADLDEDADGEADDHHKAEVGARMTAFGMNFGMPYKFIASGDSKSFEEAPAAIRAARSRLNWAQSVFVNDQTGYQDFNEELVFAYLEDQKIKYHDDGEKGLGSRIATLSLGAAATMSLRVKTKYFSQVSNTGVFTYEEPLPLPLLESSGYASGYKSKTKSAALQASAKPSNDTHAGRLEAYTELQSLRASGDSEGFRRRSKEIPKQLDLRRRQADALLSFHLTHGDIVIMEGEQIQKFLEHQVEPHGNLRFALTCRTVLPNHLPEDQLPPYEIGPDGEKYDGRAIWEEGDGEAVVWS